MSGTNEFEKAQERVKAFVKTPGAPELLALYSLYKQATKGDATGERPGLLNVRARAKFDAWNAKKGISLEEAQNQYARLVDSLAQKYSQ